MRLKFFSLLTLNLVLSSLVVPAWAWNNGGYTKTGNIPQFATHDWIALYAASWLPSSERWWIEDNLDLFLLGTELPDNSGHPLGIGDTGKHHVYFDSSGILQDDSAADRADEEALQIALFLSSGNYSAAALHAGIMSHYLVDVAVFGHVMGSGTEWGTEIHHSDYEDYVETRTNEWPTDDFSTYISYDGELSTITPYGAVIEVAYDTTFDVDGDLNCTWMDTNYNWNSATFKNRCGESLNLAANRLADVIHTLYGSMIPTPNIRGFHALFRHRSSRLVQPDTASPKALGCLPAMVSDWLASGFVFDKLTQCSEGLDTNPAFINQTSGNAQGASGTGVICFGGPVVSPLVRYAEADSTTMLDRAPIRFHDEGGYFYFQHWNGASITGASLPISVINNNEDMFVIEVYMDNEGRYIMLCYGFGWKGTYAAGKYFDKVIYPDLSTYDIQWIIVKWQDTNGDTFVNAPGGGDTYTVISTG